MDDVRHLFRMRYDHRRESFLNDIQKMMELASLFGEENTGP